MTLERVSARLDRTSFPRLLDAEREAQKLAILRIAMGLIFTWRCALMARDTYYYFAPGQIAGLHLSPQFLAACVQLLLSLGFAAGLAPRFTGLALAFTHAAFSIWTGTYNLAPMLAVPLFAGLALLDSGRLSLGRPEAPTPAAHVRIFYFVLFCAYAGWNFQALLYHFRDAYWVEGRTAAVLLVNSYLSEFYPAWRTLESWSPNGFWGASMLIGVLQSIFQIGMLPMVLFRPGFHFVRVWGWVFILVSFIDLQLSILPVVEIVYWTAIFIPADFFPLRQSPHPASVGGPAPFRHRLFFGFITVYCALLGVYFTKAIFGSFTSFRLPAKIEDTFFSYSGLVAPNVFNREDLFMGDRWPVIEWVGPAGAEFLPLNGPDGNRLAYHRSDQLYFGNSLPWRRSLIDVVDLEAYHRPGGNGYAFALAMVTYDYRRWHATEPGFYRITLFRNRASVHQERGNPRRFDPEQVFTFIIPGAKIAPQ